MSIKSITESPTGLVAVNPSVIYIDTTDTYAAVTTTGYLTSAKQFGTVFNNLQMALVRTSDDGVVWLRVSVTGTPPQVVSLVQSSAPNDTVLPTVATQLVSFNNTSGQLIGSGILLANVVTKNSVNTMAAGSQIILAKANGTEAANAVTASGNAGVITTSSLTTAGAATYVITWTNTFITATSVIGLTIQGGTNTTQDINFKVVPGAGTATLTIYNLTAATALNGTILIGYSVL